MNNVFKALVISAPAAAILFFYVVVKQSEHTALLERESARFDRVFSEIAEPKMLPKRSETFWQEMRERAKQEEEEAQKRIEEKRKKAEEVEKELEKAINETKREDIQKSLEQELKNK